MGSEDCGGYDDYDALLRKLCGVDETLEKEDAFKEKMPEGFDARFVCLFSETRGGVGLVVGLYRQMKDVLDEICEAEPDNDVAAKILKGIERHLTDYEGEVDSYNEWKRQYPIMSYGPSGPKRLGGVRRSSRPSLPLQGLKDICFPIAYRGVSKGSKIKVLLKRLDISDALKNILTD